MFGKKYNTYLIYYTVFSSSPLNGVLRAGLATVQHNFPILIHEFHLNEGHSAVITHLTCNVVNFKLPNRIMYYRN